MGRTRYRFIDDQYPYFVTFTVVEWLPIFSDPEIVTIVLDSLRFLRREREAKILAYVIMENHLHLILSVPGIGKLIKEFKSFTARKIIDLYEERKSMGNLWKLKRAKLPHKTRSTFQVWQEGSHPEQIDNDEMLAQKIEYIHHNPVKRGYVDEPEDWRYSSARDYDGKKGILEIDLESE